MCDILNISRKSVRRALLGSSKNDLRKMRMIEKILRIYHDSKGTYGSKKILMALRREGEVVSIEYVRKIMHDLNISSIVYKKFKAKKRSGLTPSAIAELNNFVKDIKVTHKDQVWTEDITYIMTKKQGFVYLASIMDLFTKKVISYEVSKVMDTGLVLRVLDKAYSKRKPDQNIIVHSDKGAQYRSRQYIDFCNLKNITRSYTRINYSCADNASQESFHASFKKEYLYQKDVLLDLNEAKEAVYEYIDNFYNPKRIHSSIGYLSPDEYEKLLDEGKVK